VGSSWVSSSLLTRPRALTPFERRRRASPGPRRGCTPQSCARRCVRRISGSPARGRPVRAAGGRGVSSIVESELPEVPAASSSSATPPRSAPTDRWAAIGLAETASPAEPVEPFLQPALHGQHAATAAASPNMPRSRTASSVVAVRGEPGEGAVGPARPSGGSGGDPGGHGQGVAYTVMCRCAARCWHGRSCRSGSISGRDLGLLAGSSCGSWPPLLAAPFLMTVRTRGSSGHGPRRLVVVS
jgi:hypothetical protein